jgi:hypothetical protein
MLLSPLELTVANSASLAMAKQWPFTALETPPRDKQTSSKDIWSGDFHCSPIDSNTCIEVTSGALALMIWTLAR